MNDITWGGVLTTAGDVVFSGGKEGYFFALDARTGELLWKASVGGQVNAGPMSYSVGGRQHVTIAAGSSLFAYACHKHNDRATDRHARHRRHRIDSRECTGPCLQNAAHAGRPARSQGFWSNAPPLERPDNVTKEFYTPEEALAAEKAAAARENAQTDPGTVADVHYDFTQFGLDRSQATLARSRRTSLIVDPKTASCRPSRKKERRFLQRARRGEEAGPLGLCAVQSTGRPLHHHGRAGAADDGRGV